MEALNDTAAWRALKLHHAQLNTVHMRDLFATNPRRAERMRCEAAGLYLDYAKHRINDETLSLLLSLANTRALPAWRDSMFAGEPINNSEGRAVLHTALRASPAPAEVSATLKRMYAFADSLRDGTLKGATGLAFTDVVNIGIGGSDLGPRMVVRALRRQCTNRPRMHFVANVDPEDLNSVLADLNPATTLFIVASKTFTTAETLSNARRARTWLELKLGTGNSGAHFAAVSSNVAAAQAFGISAERVFPMWDWVGGRYSLWSAVGLSIAIAIGPQGFDALLEGARAMDAHFREAPLENNMPVLLALLGIWYTNFFGAQTHAVLPYCADLELLADFLQQLDMESNGKRVDRDGKPLNYATAPVLWGSVGTNGQHAFHQLLHQGTLVMPSDFIVVAETPNPDDAEAHRMLLANALAQSAALMSGRANVAEPHRDYPGNQPSSTIVLRRLEPHSVGALVALYEHKVFVQGVVWGINSFDQWGVELGKSLAQSLTPALSSGKAPQDSDTSTRSLIAKLLG
ncbi:MAG TPA: glucose-6-phosphate isomerase [Burkholderiales bacterium]|nr:glucose-6-phosphate isomerase [Burkholderiales bacterium]